MGEEITPFDIHLHGAFRAVRRLEHGKAVGYLDFVRLMSTVYDDVYGGADHEILREVF